MPAAALLLAAYSLRPPPPWSSAQTAAPVPPHWTRPRPRRPRSERRACRSATARPAHPPADAGAPSRESRRWQVARLAAASYWSARRPPDGAGRGVSAGVWARGYVVARRLAPARTSAHARARTQARTHPCSYARTQAPAHAPRTRTHAALSCVPFAPAPPAPRRAAPLPAPDLGLLRLHATAEGDGRAHERVDLLLRLPRRGQVESHLHAGADVDVLARAARGRRPVVHVACRVAVRGPGR